MLWNSSGFVGLFSQGGEVHELYALHSQAILDEDIPTPAPTQVLVLCGRSRESQ